MSTTVCDSSRSKCSCATAGGLVRAFCLASALLLGALPVASASAWESSKNTEYSLAIAEGASTQPELFPIAMTSAQVSPSAEVVLSIASGGIVLNQQTGDGGVYMSNVPNVGDVVTVESPHGNVVGSVVYDGLPSLDPTVCAGSENFSGQRSAGQEVTGGYYSLALHTGPYGHTSAHETGVGQAQVTLLSGSDFAGNFLSPLALGQTVWASESLRTALAGGAIFNYSSETERPVGACPPPPPPPPSPPPPPALQGSIFKLAKITIRKLLKGGWLSEVTINQPGTVTQDLYMQDGALPAFASSVGSASRHRHHKRRTPPAQLLARGTATAKSPGTVDILIRVTAHGRKLLKHARHVKAVLITTLHSTTGAKLSLSRRSVSLRP